MKKILYISIVFFITLKSFAFPDPYYIKSAAFHQGNESLVPIFKMDESFRFSFDDLIGDEADYYYKIVHCTPDWKVSDLRSEEHTSELQSRPHLVCRLLLEKKKYLVNSFF